METRDGVSVFSVLDLVVLLLLLLVTLIWFKNKLANRFYEACKSGGVLTVTKILEMSQNNKKTGSYL